MIFRFLMLLTLLFSSATQAQTPSVNVQITPNGVSGSVGVNFGRQPQGQLAPRYYAPQPMWRYNAPPVYYYPPVQYTLTPQVRMMHCQVVVLDGVVVSHTCQ